MIDRSSLLPSSFLCVLDDSQIPNSLILSPKITWRTKRVCMYSQWIVTFYYSVFISFLSAAVVHPLSIIHRSLQQMQPK